MYHYLSDRPTSRYGVSFSEFRRQLAWLQAEGFTIDGFPELRHRLVSGQIPDRYVVITFDDGHGSCLQAAECVREVGGQASFFLTKQFCESRPNFLNPAEIRTLAGLCSVGSHGVTHDPLSRISTAQLIEELQLSKRWLEDIVGADIDTLAAPGGFINSHVVDHAIGLGYSLIGNSTEWWNSPRRVAVSRVVNRVGMRDSFGFPTFARIAGGRHRFYLSRRLRSSLLAPPKRLLPRSLVKRLFGGR
jgi:peptidoglycan/xylan/chitin deacetylase (PgdA/CDA1 family)